MKHTARSLHSCLRREVTLHPVAPLQPLKIHVRTHGRCSKVNMPCQCSLLNRLIVMLRRRRIMDRHHLQHRHRHRHRHYHHRQLHRNLHQMPRSPHHHPLFHLLPHPLSTPHPPHLLHNHPLWRIPPLIHPHPHNLQAGHSKFNGVSIASSVVRSCDSLQLVSSSIVRSLDSLEVN